MIGSSSNLIDNIRPCIVYASESVHVIIKNAGLHIHVVMYIVYIIIYIYFILLRFQESYLRKSTPLDRDTQLLERGTLRESMRWIRD